MVKRVQTVLGVAAPSPRVTPLGAAVFAGAVALGLGGPLALILWAL